MHLLVWFLLPNLCYKIKKENLYFYTILNYDTSFFQEKKDWKKDRKVKTGIII